MCLSNLRTVVADTVTDWSRTHDLSIALRVRPPDHNHYITVNYSYYYYDYCYYYFYVTVLLDLIFTIFLLASVKYFHYVACGVWFR